MVSVLFHCIPTVATTPDRFRSNHFLRLNATPQISLHRGGSALLLQYFLMNYGFLASPRRLCYLTTTVLRRFYTEPGKAFAFYHYSLPIKSAGIEPASVSLTDDVLSQRFRRLLAYRMPHTINMISLSGTLNLRSFYQKPAGPLISSSWIPPSLDRLGLIIPLDTKHGLSCLLLLLRGVGSPFGIPR